MIPPVFPPAYASAAVKALMGTSPCRLFPFGEAPQGVALPYAVWQIVGGGPENYLCQIPDIDDYTTQVDVYADTASAARAAADALRDAFEPVAYITRWGGELRDAETGHYRVTFDVEWMVSR